MKYEWDEAKNRSNFAKHGLNFQDVEQVFSGPCVTFERASHSRMIAPIMERRG